MPQKAARKKSRKKPLKLSSRKNRKQASYLFTTITLVLIASFLIFSGIVYKRVNTSFASAQDENSLNYEEKDIFTILVFSSSDISSSTPHIKNLKLVLLDKKDVEVTTVALDNQAEFEVQGKFGKEKVQDLMTLSKSVSSQDHDAEEFFVKVIENNLKLKIDRYIYVNDDQLSSIDSLFSSSNDLGFVLLLKDFAFNNLSGNLKTNVSDRELYSIFEFLSKEPTLLNKQYKEYPAFLKNVVFNSNIAEEKFMISILNGAKISGAGNYSSEVIEYAGGRATFVGNAKNEYLESIIVTDNPDSQSVKYLKSFFKVDKVENKSKFSFIESDVERADVTLILGLDFTKNIY
jgi:hypothetical protein